MRDMADSAQPNRARRWRAIIITAVAIAVLGVTAALAATVTQRPTITGTLKTGETLNATGGAWTPSSAKPEFTWLRCDGTGANCQGITGACGRDYKVRTADEGNRLRVRLTVTDTGNPSAIADSDPTAVIVPDQYRPTVGDSDTCTRVVVQDPGKGTFSSGTQTGAGSEPPVDTDTPLSFIKPFPVIRISGRFKGTRTTLTRVTVRTPRGTRVRIRCSGKGCSFKRKTVVAAKLINVRALKRTYLPKATIEIRVTKSGKVGKYTKLRTRRGKAPVRSDLCLMPGKTKPARCPVD
jgi:hypothetical protein